MKEQPFHGRFLWHLILIFFPVLLYAQPKPAGVVTALQGTAQLSRPTVAATALRFKDDVFVRDVINTQEKSLARILFGGKSSVTVRELSRLEIREETLPGGGTRSIHELSSGAILVNVARQLMRPDDEVQIRTRNAVASVRGTTIFAECSGSGDDTLCNFAVLIGNAIINPLGRPPLNLAISSRVAVAGNPASKTVQAGPVNSLPPGQATQILQQFNVKVAVTQEANRQQVAAAQTKQAAELATAVVDAVSGSGPESASTEIVTESLEAGGTTAMVNTAQIAPDLSGIGLPDLTINSGVVDFSAGGTQNFNRITITGGALDGSDTVTGANVFTWTGGSVDGTGPLNVSAGVEIGGPAVKTLNGRTLNNIGTANVTGGTLSIVNGGVFNSTGPFNNQAIVDLQSGTLNLLGGGTSSGIFSGNGTLQVGSGYTFQPGSTIANSNVIFNGGLVNVAGNYSLVGSSTTIDGGTVNFTGTVGAVGDLTISGGTANFSSGDAVAATSLNLSGGTLTGSDLVTVAGPAVWTGGTMSGSGTTRIAAGGTLDLSGPSPKLLDGRTLENGGAAIWTGGDIQLNNGATFKNLAGGLFSVQADQTVGFTSALPGIFSNEGLFDKSAGPGTTTIATLFNNEGRVEVRAGTLTLSGGGAGGGIFSIAGGATLDFAAGVHNLSGGTIEALDGSVVELSGATIAGGRFSNSGSGVIRNSFNSTLSGVTINAGSRIDNPDGRTLHLSGTITNNGAINNSSTGGGTDIRAADGTTLGGGGVLVMSNNTNNRLLGESAADRLVNGAAHTIQGSGQIGADLMGLTNQGVIAANQAAPLVIDTSAAGFVNEGVLRANAGSTLTVVDSLANSGAAIVEAAGTVNLNGGATGLGTYNVTGGALNVAGNLSNVSGGAFNLPNSVLSVADGGVFATTTGAAAMVLNGGTINTGSNFISLSGGGVATMAGAILNDTGSTFNVGNEFLSVSGGSAVTGASRDAAFSFSGSTVNTASNFAEISGTGSKVTLSGSLLSAGGSLNVGTNPGLNGDVLDINSGGQLIMNSAEPVLAFNGGNHVIGTADTTTNRTQNQIARLQANSVDGTTGLGTFQAVKGDGVNPAPFAGATNPIGTLVKGADGAALEVRAGAGDTAPGAPVFGGNAVRLDTVLFEASLPIIELLGAGSNAATATRLTTAGDAMDISRSKVVGLGPVVALDNGLIHVTNGAFITLRSGSNVDVTGDLLRLFNGSRIEVVNGPLIRVTGNSGGGTNPAVSTLNVSGALVNFGGSGGNTIVVNNNIPVTANRGGPANNQFPVNIGGGASIAIGANPVKNPALGSITVNGTGGAGTGVLIQATGGGKVNIAAP